MKTCSFPIHYILYNFVPIQADFKFISVGMMIRSPFNPDEYSDSHPKDKNIIHIKNLWYVWRSEMVLKQKSRFGAKWGMVNIWGRATVTNYNNSKW